MFNIFTVIYINRKKGGVGMPAMAVKELELTTTVFKAKSGVPVDVCQYCNYYEKYKNPVLDFGNFHKIIGSCSFSLDYSGHRIGGGEIRAECGRT